VSRPVHVVVAMKSRSSGVQPARASVARAADSASASAPSQNRALSSSTVSFGVKRAGSIQRWRPSMSLAAKKPAPALVGIPGERQDLRLRVTIRRHGGGNGSDARRHIR